MGEYEYTANGSSDDSESWLEFDCYECVRSVWVATTCRGRRRHPSEIRCPRCGVAPARGLGTITQRTSSREEQVVTDPVGQ